MSVTSETGSADRAVFWDFHGTLAVPRHLWGESVFAAARSACAPGEPAFALEEVKKYTKAGWYPWDRYEEDFSAWTGEKWWDFMCARLEEIYLTLGLGAPRATAAAREARRELTKPERYALYPQAIPVLQECKKRGWKNVLLSNHVPELPKILAALGAKEYFDAIVVSSLVGYDKPRREIFGIAKRAAGNPSVCVMIGDNPEADIRGGAEAGMETILVNNVSALCQREPTFRARTLDEVLPLLERMFEK